MQRHNEHNRCMICGSLDISSMDGYEQNYLYKCNTCTFVFCKKIPSLEELMEHYGNYPRIEEISSITLRRFEEIIDGFEPVRKTNRVLDVGCGNGHLLQVAKQKNWEVYGTEYTDFAVNICKSKGINMIQGELDILNYEEESFDLIFFIEVIEHINTPNDELQKMYKLLRKGGILYITTPNFNSLSSRILKEKWDVIEYMEHLCYYTKRTLNKLLKNNGFEKVELLSTGISINRFKKSNQKYGQTPRKSITDEEFRVLSESKTSYKVIKKLVNFVLNRLSLGDALKATYFKK